MKRVFFGLLAACGIAACGDPEPRSGPVEPIGEARPLPRDLPAQEEGEPRYVGLWATTQQGCANPAFKFEPQSVTTQGEVHCDFQTVTATPNGYDIEAMCAAEAPPQPARLVLSFSPAAGVMMVTGGPWAIAPSLVHCSDLPPPAVSDADTAP